MYDNDSKGISYTAGFFMLIAFTVAGVYLAGALSDVVLKQMTGRGLLSIRDHLSDPENSNAMKVVQVITFVVGFFLPAMLAATLLHRRPARMMGFTGKITLNQVVLTVFIMIASLLVASSLSYITTQIPIPSEWKVRFDRMETEYNEQVSAIISLRTTGDYIIAMIVMAFLPAVCEETLFRGGLQNFLSRGTKSPWLSIIAVSFLFSLAHISYYGFLFRFFLGLSLGALYFYSGRLWLSILAHFLNNALTITVLFYYLRQGKTMEQAMTDSAGSFWGMFALPVVVGLFILLRKTSNPKIRLA